MKRILLIIFIFLNIQNAFTQNLNIDSIINLIAHEKDDDKIIDLIVSFYNPEINNKPNKVIDIGLKLLKQSQIDHSKIEESAANGILGHGYRLLGNNIKGLTYHHKAIALAEKSGNLAVLAIAENQIAHVYKDREQYDKAIQFYLSSANHAEKGNNPKIKSWPLLNLGSVYLSINKLDSSLMYSQRGYELDLIYDRSDMVFSYINLAVVHSRLGNAQLAISYFNMALNEAQGKTYSRYLNMVYTGLAEHYLRNNQKDSTELYARKAIAVTINTPFFYLSNKPAQLLIDLYDNKNCDSTLKYSKILKIANDSLTNTKISQQIQSMTLEEDLRQQELVSEKIIKAEERSLNIQYALIALGIIILISLYLLLSRSFITSAKAIEFFGIIALLIVFEFLNLLLHPFLERITHHSPLLMLLGLVLIAVLLVPLHHRLEKWATSRLVKKNKQIRLAAAKRTIEQLEKNNNA